MGKRGGGLREGRVVDKGRKMRRGGARGRKLELRGVWSGSERVETVELKLRRRKEKKIGKGSYGIGGRGERILVTEGACVH